MAVKIRLMRVGKKKQPTYRVVVADSRSPRDGRIIETIGQYGPRHDPSFIDIDGERALAWLRQGAQPSEQVQKLLTTTGVWATFEGEKSSPPVTQLSRRAYVTGRGAPTKKVKKAEPEAAEPKAAVVAEPAAEAPAAQEPVPAEAAAAPEESVDAPDESTDETPDESPDTESGE